jgi:hypothetical protein
MSAIVASRSSNCSELWARPIPVKAIAVAKIAVAKTSRYVRKWRFMVYAPLEDEALISRDFQFQPRLCAGGYACRPLVSSPARPHALTGDAAKARAAYQDFLTLWKGADPDIPILRAAKAE